MEVERGSVDLVRLGLHKRKKLKMEMESPRSNEKLCEESKRGCQYIIISVDAFYKLKTWKKKSRRGKKKDSRPKEQLSHDFPLWRGEDGPEVKRKVRVTGTGQSQGLRPQRQTHGWLLL